MEEGTRPAEPADGPELVRLADLARVELGAERDGPMFLLADANTSAGEVERWVATLDGHVVGYAAAHLEHLAQGQVLAVIDEIFVEPAAREVSLGEALVDRVGRWAGEHRAIGIDALVLPGTRNTKNFFEANGFKARLLRVHRPLSGHPGRGDRYR